MGGRSEDRGLWLALAAITVLLVLLAALQYRWTSEISRAEAERRQTALERAAARFDAAFDRELGQLAWAFFLEPATRPSERHQALLARLASWQRSDHSAMLASVMIATSTDSGPPRLEACDASAATFREVPWPPELAPLRERLEGTGEGGEGRFMRPVTILDPPLVLPVPLVEGPERPSPNPRRGPFRLGGLLLLRLDLAYLRDQLLPQLAEAHFGPLAESEFTIVVARKADQSVVYSSLADAAPPDPADVRRTLGGRGGRPGPDRPDAGRGPGFGTRVSPPEPSGTERRPPEDEGPWVLLARHRGGSLEQAVARVRRRNLAVGFGVLGLLGTTAVLLAIGGQRARRLAHQQMEFVAGVTHELHTPLAAIRSAGQNLADGIVKDPQQVRRYGGLIEKEGARLSGLVAQVLEFAGIRSPGRVYAAEPLSVPTLVDDVLRDHRLVLEQAGLVVERDVASELPSVRGDADALHRALSNLVGNAAKFATSGRWLAVRASLRPDGRAVVVRVEDRGPGIPPGERSRVFEPFFRGSAAERNETPGNGLGLSLVRHVVRAHGGTVRVDGREGGGTAVVVELPVPAGREAAE